MNTKKLRELKQKSKQTLKILEMIEKGLSPREIAIKAKCDRQLCDYYFRVIK